MKSTNKVVLNAIAANSRVACNSATIVIKPSPSAEARPRRGESRQGRGMNSGYPKPEVAKAWMKNHVCTPKDGIPKSFIDADGIEWSNENADDNEGMDLL